MSSHSQQLVARAREGEEAAFRALVQEHSRAVYGRAYQLTGDPHDAEDVVQETFLKVFRNLDGFDGRSRFETWLYRVATNAAMDLMRKRQRHASRRAEIEAPSGDPLPVEAPIPDPEHRAEGRAVGERIEHAMSRLTVGERAAFTLRHVEGQSIREIGEALGLKDNAVKNAVFRAVQKMRRELAPLTSETS